MWCVLFLGIVPAIVSALEHPRPQPTVGPDDVLYASEGNYLYAVTSDGSAKWIFDTHVEGPSPPTAVSSYALMNGTVYVVAGHTTLFALDSWDGSIKWKHHVSAKDRSELVVANDGTVYFMSGERNTRDPPFEDPKFGPLFNVTIDAIDSSGALKWNFTNFGSGDSGLACCPIAIGADGAVMVRNYTTVYVLQPSTGSVAWSVEAHDVETFWDLERGSTGFQVDDAAFDEDGNVFLLASWATELGPLMALSRLNHDDGSTLWQTVWDVDHWHPFTMTLGRNKEVYVNGAVDGDMPAGPGNCNIVDLDYEGNVVDVSSPCLDNAYYESDEDAFVNVTSESNNVLAYRLNDPDHWLLWNVSLPEKVESSVAFGQNGVVFVQSETNVYAIRNGEVAWMVPEEILRGTYPIMSKDGTTYVQGLACKRECSTEIVAVGADGVEKWRYTPTNSAVELV